MFANMQRSNYKHHKRLSSSTIPCIIANTIAEQPSHQQQKLQQQWRPDDDGTLRPWLMVVVIVLLLSASGAQAGCRRQETFECEKVCRLNETTSKHECTLRLAVILSNNTNSEASLQKVSAGASN